MQAPDTSPAAPPRRDDAGTFKITDRDITGMTLCAEQYGAPYDLLAAALDVTVDRLRGIVQRWRHAGYAATGSLGRGPAWCWLTPAGMDLLGLPYPAKEPSATRLAHIRAVLAVRLWLQADQDYSGGQAWWRCERRIRAAVGTQAGTAHVPDAEVHWPSLDDAPHAGQIWAIEAELTAKPLPRTIEIMQALLARASDYDPGAARHAEPRYGQVLYWTAPAAAPTVTRAIAALPEPLHAKITAHPLPPGATR
ncbi:MAG: replication-relaxation family protein [Actinobacteria bacterium]|nr:replication-relaxation family protein [Actinomycetota bacterium]